MKERPILFSGPMVRELLAGRKTQTRRPVKRFADDPGAAMLLSMKGAVATFGHSIPDDPVPVEVTCPYGAPSDLLWVRETWCPLDGPHHFTDPSLPRDHLSDRYGTARRNGAAYRAETDADGERCRQELGYKWKPAIHMPRWASRLLLEVEAVRAERLDDISEADARAEGMHFDGLWWHGAPHHIKGTPRCLPSARDALLDRWDTMYAGGPWERARNPWIWVVTFRRVEAARSAA